MTMEQLQYAIDNQNDDEHQDKCEDCGQHRCVCCQLEGLEE